MTTVNQGARRGEGREQESGGGFTRSTFPDLAGSPVRFGTVRQNNCNKASVQPMEELEGKPAEARQGRRFPGKSPSGSYRARARLAHVPEPDTDGSVEIHEQSPRIDRTSPGPGPSGRGSCPDRGCP